MNIVTRGKQPLLKAISLKLLNAGVYGYLAPTTLVFYGLGLLNASRHTLKEIRSLAIVEIFLGLTGLFIPGFGLVLWILGFGVLHIIYGIIMYKRYEA